MAKGNIRLISDQIAIACIFRMRGLLLVARELLVLNICRLWLNLELGIFIISTIQFLNFINVINLRLIQLMIGFRMLQTLVDLENSTTISTHGSCTSCSDLIAETLLRLQLIHLIAIVYHSSLFVR